MLALAQPGLAWAADNLGDAAASAGKDLARGLAAAHTGKIKVTTVALPAFQEVGPAAAGWGAKAAQAFGAALAESAKLTTVAVDSDKAKGKPGEIAKSTGAQATLVGEVQDTGDKLTVSARLVFAITGAVLATSRQAFPVPAKPAPAAEAPKAAPAPAPEPAPALAKAGAVESDSVEVAIRKLSDRLADGFGKMPGNSRYRRLAVVPFNDLGEQAKKRQIGAIVTSEIATDLRRDHGILLVERAQLGEIITEKKQMALLGDDTSATTDLGKLADAQALIIGSVGDAGDRYLVNARVVSTEDGKTLAAESTSVPAAKMVALASEAVVLRSKSAAVFRSVLIPGWGQFYNRQEWKGWLFLGGEAALLGTALGFHLAGNTAASAYSNTTTASALSATGSTPSTEATRLYNQAVSRYSTRNTVLYVAAGVWALNIIDAFASGTDGQAMLSGGVSSRERKFTPLVSAGPSGGMLGAAWRW